VTARTYRFVVEGELDDRYAVAFEGMTISRHAGSTVFEGVVHDQAHLRGLRHQISALGLTLVGLRMVDREVDGRT
jgi:hypothetical protein